MWIQLLSWLSLVVIAQCLSVQDYAEYILSTGTLDVDFTLAVTSNPVVHNGTLECGTGNTCLNVEDLTTNLGFPLALKTTVSQLAAEQIYSGSAYFLFQGTLSHGVAFRAIPGTYPPTGFISSLRLSPQNEVHSVTNTGSGYIALNLDYTSSLLTVMIQAENLSGNITGIHLHCDSADTGTLCTPGEVCGVCLNLGNIAGNLQVPLTVTATVSNAIRSQMIKGNGYINVHTIDYPAGEVRGNLEPVPGTRLFFSGLNEVAGVVSTAGGQAAYAVNTGTKAANFALRDFAAPGSPLIAVNLHCATPCSGGVSCGVCSDLDSLAGQPTLPTTVATTLDATTETRLYSGNSYFDIYTTDHPAGEIRANLPVLSMPVPMGSVVSAFALEGTSSIAKGYTTFVLDSYTLNVDIRANFLSGNVTGVQFHCDPTDSGTSCTAGGSCEACLDLGNLAGSLVDPLYTTFIVTDNVREQLLKGNGYVNISTTAYPEGEIRGYLLPIPATVFAPQSSMTLLGAFARPATVSQIAGPVGYALDTGTRAVTFMVSAPTYNITGVDVHCGSQCQSGFQCNLCIALGDVAGSVAMPMTVSTFLDSTTSSHLLSGRVYLNLHTTVYPKGELRAQVPATQVSLPSIGGIVSMFGLFGFSSAPPTNFNYPTTEAPRGYVSMGLDTNLHIRIEPMGIMSGILSIHLHCDSTNSGTSCKAEDTCNVCLDIGSVAGTLSLPLDASFAISDPIRAEILSGNGYISVKTSDFSSGELRGNLVPAPINNLVLSGLNQVPPMVSTSTGQVGFALNMGTRTITTHVTTMGLAYPHNTPSVPGGGITSVDLHCGASCGGGNLACDVCVPLSDLAGGLSVPMAVTTTLNDTTTSRLLSGESYVNMATNDHPMGELRANVYVPLITTPASGFVSAIPLSDANANPPADNNAEGAVVFSLDTTVNLLAVTVTVSRITDPITQVHFNCDASDSGLACTSGLTCGLCLDFGSIAGNLHFPMSFTTSVSDEIRSQILKGNGYIHITTNQDPFGALRGDFISAPGTSMILLGSNVVPPIVTPSSGHATVALNTGTNAVDLLLESASPPASSVTSASLHCQATCSGNAICPSCQDIAGPLTFPIASRFHLDDSPIMNVMSGNAYLSIPTTSYPSGEIRAHIPQAPAYPAAGFVSSFGLVGSNVIPPVTTPAQGFVSLSLNYNVLTITVGITELSSALTGIHLHCDDTDGGTSCMADQTCSPCLDLDAIAGSLTLPLSIETTVADNIRSQILKGNAYISVQTSGQVGGEVRGNLAPSPATNMLLTGSAAVPRVVTDSMSQASYSLNTATGVATFTIQLETPPTSTITAVHLHCGASCTNSATCGVCVDIGLVARSLLFPITISTTLDTTTMNLLTAGHAYFQIHTAIFPAGEIRANAPTTSAIQYPASGLVSSFSMLGTNSVPEVTTLGKGFTLLSLEGNILSINIRATMLTGSVTGVHLHCDPTDSTISCISGDTCQVCLDFGAMAGSLNFPMTVTANISDSVRNQILRGNGYINVHTTAFPTGEVRGNLLPAPGAIAGSESGMALLGSLAVPAVNTPSIGTVSAFMDVGARAMSMVVDTIRAPSSAIVGVDLHCGPDCTPGVLCDVCVPLGSYAGNLSMPMTVSTTLAADIFNHILDGNAYINIRTMDYPTGELRANIHTIYNASIEEDQGTFLLFPLLSDSHISPVNSQGIGYGLISLYGTSLKVQLEASGLTGSVTGVQLHCDDTDSGTVLCTAGQSCSVCLNIAGAGSIPLNTNLEITSSVRSQLLKGNAYINVLTDAHVSGELRGALGPIPATNLVFSGTLEQPVSSTHTSLAMRTGTNALTWMYDSKTLPLPSYVRVHCDAICKANAVCAECQDPGVLSVWQPPTYIGSRVDTQLVEHIASGDAYFGIGFGTQSLKAHIPAAHSMPTTGLVSSFALLPSLEQPSLYSVFARGYATLSLDNNLLHVMVAATELNPVTGIHIHCDSTNGATQCKREDNCPVCVDLGAIAGSLALPLIVNTTVSDAIRTQILNGNGYINIHTTNFPSGEIRGNLPQAPGTSMIVSEYTADCNPAACFYPSESPKLGVSAYSLSVGTNAAKFVIDATTGLLNLIRWWSLNCDPEHPYPTCAPGVRCTPCRYMYTPSGTQNQLQQTENGIVTDHAKARILAGEAYINVDVFAIAGLRAHLPAAPGPTPSTGYVTSFALNGSVAEGYVVLTLDTASNVLTLTVGATDLSGPLTSALLYCGEAVTEAACVDITAIAGNINLPMTITTTVTSSIATYILEGKGSVVLVTSTIELSGNLIPAPGTPMVLAGSHTIPATPSDITGSVAFAADLTTGYVNVFVDANVTGDITAVNLHCGQDCFESAECVPCWDIQASIDATSFPMFTTIETYGIIDLVLAGGGYTNVVTTNSLNTTAEVRANILVAPTPLPTVGIVSSFAIMGQYVRPTAVDTRAKGYAIWTMDTQSNNLVATVGVEFLSSAITSIAIHCDGMDTGNQCDRGAECSRCLDLSTIAGSLTLPLVINTTISDIIKIQLVTGNAYLSIETEMYPNGEVRGNMIAAPRLEALVPDVEENVPVVYSRDLALNATVYAAYVQPNPVIHLINDGNLDTFYLIVNPPKPHIIFLDLQRPHTVAEIRVYWAESYASSDYTIKGSKDNVTFELVQKVFEGDLPCTSTGEACASPECGYNRSEIYTVGLMTVRYLQLDLIHYCDTVSQMYGIRAIEIYGATPQASFVVDLQPPIRHEVATMTVTFEVPIPTEVGTDLWLTLPSAFELHSCSRGATGPCSSQASLSGLSSPAAAVFMSSHSGSQSVQFRSNSTIQLWGEHNLTITNVRTPNSCADITYNITTFVCEDVDFMGWGRIVNHVCSTETPFQIIKTFTNASTGTPQGCTPCNACYPALQDAQGNTMTWECMVDGISFTRSGLEGTCMELEV